MNCNLKTMICAFLGILSFQLTAQQKGVGIGTDNPDPSAALHVSAYYSPQDTVKHGFLMPRVALVTPTNNTSPVANPVDGTLVFNTTIDSSTELLKALYFWNGSESRWDRGLYYRETPKTSVVKFSGNTNDYFILSGYPYSPGAPVTIGSAQCLQNNYLNDSFASFMGLQPIQALDNSTGVTQNFLTIAPGKYLLEVSMAFIAPTCSSPSWGGCTTVAGDYYYMGLLYDFYMGTYTTSGSSHSATFLPRQRKEDGFLSKINETFRLTQYYSFEIPDDGQNYLFKINIARMSGSSFYGGYYVVPSDSYFKLNKF